MTKGISNGVKKVLITGGAGFIGANLIRRLLGEGGFEIFVIEKEGVNFWRLEDIKDQIDITYVDLEDEAATKEGVDKIRPHIVFHLASSRGNAFAQGDPRTMIRVNIEGTMNLIEALKSIRMASFTYASTSLEYKEKEGKLAEDDAQEPRNFYALTKSTGGQVVKQYANMHHLPVVNVRLFNVYGYYEDSQNLIPSIVLGALRNQPIALSSPNNVRDFIFIEDVVDLFTRIITQEHAYRGEMFNAGSGEQHSIQEVVGTVEKVLGRRLDVRYGQRPSYYKEPKVFVADNTKAREAFGWEVKHSFASGIQRTIEWFEQNQDLYEAR